MATVLRPPLVFPPQRKRWVGTPDAYPNLLATTLKPAAFALPLSAVRLSESAPPPKRPVQVDCYPNVTVILGTDTTNVPIVQIYGDAPARKPRLSVDTYPNLLQTTLGAPAVLGLPLLAQKLCASAPPSKRPVVAQQLDVRAVWRDPVPLFLRIDGNAPISRVRAQVDCYPNLSLTTLAPPPATFALPLSALKLDASAPPPKQPVVAQQLDVRSVWRDPVPQFLQLNGSAPVSKVRIQVDGYPNLSLTLSGGAATNSISNPFESLIFTSRVLQ